MVAFTAYVSSFAAVEARLTGTFRAVSSNVTHLVAIVAGRFIGALGAITGYVANAVTVVTPILFLLTVASKVTKPVTFVAFVASSRS